MDISPIWGIYVKIYIPRDIYFTYIPQQRDIYKYISLGIYILSIFVPEKIEPSESGGNESLRALKHRNCLVENRLIYYHPCSNFTTDYHPVFPWRGKKTFKLWSCLKKLFFLLIHIEYNGYLYIKYKLYSCGRSKKIVPQHL